MVHRLERLIGKDADKVWAGTFHHAANRLLRQSAKLLGYQPNFTILDSEDRLDLIRLAMEDAGLAGKESWPKPAQIEHLLSFALNTRQTLAAVAAVQSPELVEWLPRIEIVSTAYAVRKLAANCMDYDDLLTQWLRLLREFPEQLEHQASRFRHLLIDEMQDTNALQVEIIETIAASGAGNLTVVGDDAQSIYRFRGATTTIFSGFPSGIPGPGPFISRSTTGPRLKSSPSQRRRSGTTSRGFPSSWSRRGETDFVPRLPPRPTFTRRPT